MLTFHLPKEIVQDMISKPTFQQDIAFSFVQKLLPKATYLDGFVWDGTKRYKIFCKTLKQYAAKYVSYGVVKDSLCDGYIVCALAPNYGEFYLYGISPLIQIDNRGSSHFYLNRLNKFGLWNSIECKRRGL